MIGDWDFSTGRLPGIVIAEVAFLVTLTSADTGVALVAAKGLREIAIAECLPNPRRTVEETDDVSKRYPLYEQLGDPSFIVVGGFLNKLVQTCTYFVITRPSCSAEEDQEIASTSYQPLPFTFRCLV